MTANTLALESNQILIEKVISKIPESYELTRTINTYAPDLVFMVLSSWDSALTAAYRIRGISPQTAIIGFGREWKPWQVEHSKAAGLDATARIGLLA